MKKEKLGDAMLERLKIAACCKNYTELAERLDVSKSQLAEARRTGRLQPEMREKLMLHGINYLWVEKEVGPRLFEESDQYKYH